MKFKVRLIVLCFLVVFIFANSGRPVTEDEGGGLLKIYLPREVVVEDDAINLGSVGIVRAGSSESARACSVSLGRFALAGQEIVIDRATILSCLASSGLDTSKVLLSGASEVVVKREEEKISASRIVAIAQEYLEKHLNTSVSRVTATTKPKSYVLESGGGKIDIVARMSRYSTNEHPKVLVTILQDGEEKESCDITFSLKYKCRQAVATADIDKGGIISKENVKIETLETSTPEPADWRSPYGMQASRMIRKDATIQANMFGSVAAAVVIKRRQTVLVKVETSGLYVSSFGEAMEDGTEGQYIRVKMGTDRYSRTIVGKVCDDGSVSPLL